MLNPPAYPYTGPMPLGTRATSQPQPAWSDGEGWGAQSASTSLFRRLAARIRTASIPRIAASDSSTSPALFAIEAKMRSLASCTSENSTTLSMPMARRPPGSNAIQLATTKMRQTQAVRASQPSTVPSTNLRSTKRNPTYATVRVPTNRTAVIISALTSAPNFPSYERISYARRRSGSTQSGLSTSPNQAQ